MESNTRGRNSSLSYWTISPRVELYFRLLPIVSCLFHHTTQPNGLISWGLCLLSQLWRHLSTITTVKEPLSTCSRLIGRLSLLLQHHLNASLSTKRPSSNPTISWWQFDSEGSVPMNRFHRRSETVQWMELIEASAGTFLTREPKNRQRKLFSKGDPGNIIRAECGGSLTYIPWNITALLGQAAFLLINPTDGGDSKILWRWKWDQRIRRRVSLLNEYQLVAVMHFFRWDGFASNKPTIMSLECVRRENGETIWQRLRWRTTAQ